MLHLQREMKGEMPKEEMTDMCIECGEHRPLPEKSFASIA